MKATIPQSALRAVLDRACKISPARGIIPIISHVRISAGDVLHIHATDLDIHSSERVEGADIQDAGDLCVPAHDLQKLVVAARKSEISIETTGGGDLRVSWGRSSATLRTLSSEDFPKSPGEKGVLSDIDGQLLAKALRYTGVSASREETQFYLCGAYIHSGDAGTAVYGTDGKSLHRAQMPMLNAPGSAIIPNAAIPLIVGAADLGPMRFSLSETSWGLAAGNLEMWGKVIDGTYPDAERIIPKGAQLIATFDREDMLEAIAVASIGSDDRHAKVVIDAEGDHIQLRCITPSANVAAGARSDFSADVKEKLLLAVDANLVKRAISAMDVDVLALMSDGRDMVTIEPAEQRTEMGVAAIVMKWRASAEQLAA